MRMNLANASVTSSNKLPTNSTALSLLPNNLRAILAKHLAVLENDVDFLGLLIGYVGLKVKRIFDGIQDTLLFHWSEFAYLRRTIFSAVIQSHLHHDGFRFFAGYSAHFVLLMSLIGLAVSVNA